MQVSELWLREWVNPPADTHGLVNALTMAGLEVDGLTPAAPAFSGVVAARIIELAPHSKAKKGHVCEVDDGSGQPLTVVCTADNVRAGLMTALARVGAQLPGQAGVEKKQLYGVESMGMLCSYAELGLADASEGIIELPESCEPGEDLYEVLELNDTVIDIDLTPNRSDCLSVCGLAREVSALLEAPVRELSVKEVSAETDTVFPVSIEAPEACARYVGRVITRVSGDITSPLWLREKLRRGGLRSVNAITDITNYVMLELGQPMHAFDLDKLASGIEVRFARSSESLCLLNDQEVSLSKDELVIADAEGPLALAGIMGGERSCVGDQTQSVFLEAAWFHPQTLAGKARRHGLHTDSSHRFERGVDPELAATAIHRATELIVEITGGQPGPVVIEESASRLPQPATIRLDVTRAENLLGIELTGEEIEVLLKRLHCEVARKDNILQVLTPAFRTDLAIEVDLIEEIARLKGYENLPDTNAGPGYLATRHQAARTDPVEVMKNALVMCGYSEVISFSFVSQDVEKLFNPGHDAKVLANPISQDLAVMRSSIWPGLTQAAIHNFNRQQERVRFFEQGLQFCQTPQGLEQRPVLSGLVSGHCEVEQWGVSPREVDFYDLKGDVEHLLEVAGLAPDQLRTESLEDAGLHPGKAAKILYKDEMLVRFGALHPRIQAALGISQEVYLFELQLDGCPDTSSELMFKPLSKYPFIRRDITLIVDQAVQAAQICSNIEQMQIPCLQQVEIFSVYTGDNIQKGKKSISLGLILQEFSRTLTDKEVEQTITSIVSQLEHQVGAGIRS